MTYLKLLIISIGSLVVLWMIVFSYMIYKNKKDIYK
jgi:hypothetical protein